MSQNNSHIANIILGTANLGLPDYGYSSDSHRKLINFVDYFKELNNLGIHKFDTSPRYGNAEATIGEYTANINNRFICSKIDNLTINNPESPKIMEDSVVNSLRKLNAKHLDICYLHQNDINILSDKYVHEGIDLLKDKNLVRDIGASVYAHNECEYAICSNIYDVIQVPINITDVSFYNNYISSEYRNIKFVARSLLLQGTLANRNSLTLHKYYAEIKNYLIKLEKIIGDHNIDITKLALSFVYSLKGINHFIISSTKVNNIKYFIDCLKAKLPPNIYKDVYYLASKHNVWSNPKNW